jgi:hypothetical protein
MVAMSPGGDTISMRQRGTDSNMASWCRQRRPASSEVDAAGVPTPATSSVDSRSHLANHQANASHDGITVSSAFLSLRTNALASHHAISRSRRHKRTFAEKIPAVRPGPCVSGISAMCLPQLPSSMTLAPIWIPMLGLVGTP